MNSPALTPLQIARNSLKAAGYNPQTRVQIPSVSDNLIMVGSNRQIMETEATEVIASGSAGTGKSVSWLRKLHVTAVMYPGSRQAIIRKTRVSLTESALVTYEQKVLGLNHPMLHTGATRAHRHNYTYPNGSEIIIAGLDTPSRVLSTEFDRIYVQEAIELNEEDWETLLSRLRNGKTPYHQLGGDTNPDAPAHWLNQRSLRGQTPMIFCKHEDNPRLYWDGQWTQEGIEYLSKLDALTGVRKERLRYGRWVQAEGVVYDNFSVESNVSEDAEYNPDWRLVWGVDDGYAQGAGVGTESYHPRVILLANITPQGGVNVFYEYLATGELSDMSVANVLALPYKHPDLAYIDSSAAELKARIWGAGISATGATHPVSEGIKNLRRLICDGNGVRLLKVHPRCKNLIREFQSYRYNVNSQAVAGEPKPIKQDDHALDALRYATYHLRFT